MVSWETRARWRSFHAGRLGIFDAEIARSSMRHLDLGVTLCVSATRQSAIRRGVGAAGHLPNRSPEPEL